MKRLSKLLVIGAVAAITALSTTGLASAGTTLRFCAGSPSGNYTFSAVQFADRAGNAFDKIEIIPTGGSLDNLRRLMNNECDMAMSQDDVQSLFVQENPASLSVIEQFKVAYQEYVHLLCPSKLDVDSITDLPKNARIIVGPDGGGSAETWRALRQSNDDRYGRIERLPDSVGSSSVSMVKDSKETNPTCMLWVSGLNSPDMQLANMTSVNTRDHKPALKLISVDDKSMRDILGSDGNPLYTFAEITRVEPQKGADGKLHGGFYNNLIPDGWGADTVTVPMIDAKIMVRSDFKKANIKALDRFSLAIEDALPTIWARVNPESQN